MADAELGVIITTNADEAAGKIDQFAVSTKGAATNASDLAVANTKLADSFKDVSGMAPRTSLADMFDDKGQLKRSATDWVKDLRGVGSQVTATGQSVGFLQSLWQGMRSEISRGFDWRTGFGLLSSGAKDAASGLGTATSATHLFRDSIYLLNPVLGSMGTQLGGMRGYASLARTGILGIATAITAVLITALEKASETIDLTERSLKHLLDSSALGGGIGARTFDEMKVAADRMGVSVNSLREGVGALGIALQRTGEGPQWIGDAPAAANNATKAFELFSDAIRVDQKDMSSATKIATDFVNSLTKIETAEQRVSKLGANWQIESTLTKIQKNAGLTLDAFVSLEKNAPFFASQIARAYNTDIAGMERLLQSGPRALQEMLTKVGAIAPKIQSELSKLTPTVSGEWDRLTSAFGRLWAEIGKSSGVTTASRMLETLTDRISRMNDEIKKGSGVWESFWHQMPSSGDVWKGMMAGSTESVEIFARAIRDAWNSIVQYISSTDVWKLISANARVEWDTIKQIASNAWNTIREGASDIWSGFSNLASTAWNSVTQSANSAWTGIATGAKAALDATSSFIMGIVQNTVNAVIRLVSAAAQALASLRGASGSMGGGGGSFGGPSFTYGGGAVDVSGSYTGIYAPPTYAGGTSGGTFYNAPGYASGGAFQVSGPGGTDSVPVRFMATPGEVVTITPNNLTSPARLAGMAEANLPVSTMSQGSGATTNATPAKAITEPITFAVKDSSGKVVGAVNDATSAINAMASTVASAVSSGGGGGGGATNIGGGAGGFTYSGKAGTAGGPLGSGPIDYMGNIVPSTQKVYISRMNFNSPIAGMPGPGAIAAGIPGAGTTIGAGGVPVYAINPNYRGFATGGSFVAQGSGGIDSSYYAMALTPGEKVTVTPIAASGLSAGSSWEDNRLQSLITAIKMNSDNATTQRTTAAASSKVGNSRPIIINVYGASNPMAFVASEAAIKRSVRRAMA